MNTLLVIDDRKIRERAFGAAEKLIRKLERLEAELATFQKEDQRLYSDWYDLTFREHQQRIADLKLEFEQLATFHNSIVAVSEMLDLSMPEAYRFLRNEEDNYRFGTDADRTRIDADRRARETFMRDRIADEAAEQQKSAHENAQKARAREEEDSAALARIEKLSDDEMRAVCRDYDQAYLILMQILLTVRSPNDARLLLRVWDLFSPHFQKKMAKDFERDEGGRLFLMLENLRDDLDGMQEARGTHESQRPTPEAAPPKPAPETESKLERLKLLYRKLVRRLHPDVNAHATKDQRLASWHEKVWHRVQAAYQSEDIGLLRKIERLVLIRNRHLNEITVSEIHESQSWIQEEIDRLNKEAKSLKKQPAWKFSKKKDHSEIRRKIEKSFEVQFQNINDEIDVLADEHRMFEVMSRPSAIRRARRRI